MRPPRRSTRCCTLFPYTTLFRSRSQRRAHVARGRGSGRRPRSDRTRSKQHTSELQSHSNISYAVFCLKKKSTVWQPYREGGPQPDTRGFHINFATVQFNKLPHERQTDSHSRLRAAGAGVRLTKHLENVRQERSVDSLTSIGN